MASVSLETYICVAVRIESSKLDIITPNIVTTAHMRDARREPKGT